MSPTLFSQNYENVGNPFSVNLKDENYNFIASQTWGIVEDKYGKIFFGNNSGVVEYDGSTYRVITISEDIAVRSLSYNYKEDRIYVGSESEIGYIANCENGTKKYFKISVSGLDLEVKTTWKTYTIEDTTYFFISRGKILKYHKDVLTPIVIPEHLTIFRGFLLENKIIAVDEDYGFCIVQNDSLVPLNTGKDISKFNVRCILRHNDSTFLVATEKQGLYFWHVKKNNFKDSYFEFYDTPINNFMTENIMYYGIKNGNYYIFSSLTYGILIVDTDFNIKYYINTDNGLNSNGVYYLFNDRYNNVWIGTENGVTFLDLNSPFNQFSEKEGISGTISAITLFNSKLMVGTFNGIHYLDNNKFQYIKSKEIFITNFLNIKDDKTNQEVLLATSLRNIIQINSKLQIKDIYELYTGWGILKSQKQSNRLFFSHFSGIISMEYKINNTGEVNFYNEHSYDSIESGVQTMTYDSRGNIWGATSVKGLIMIEFKTADEQKDYIVHKYDTTSGLPSNYNNYVFNYKNKIIVTTKKGIYALSNPDSNYTDYKFVNITHNFGFRNRTLTFYRINIDKYDNIIFFTSQGIFKYFASTKILVYKQFKNITDIGESSIIFNDNKAMVWFGVKNKLISYDEKKMDNIPKIPKPLFRKIVIGGKNIFDGAYVEDKDIIISDSVIKYIPKIEYVNNYISIEYALPFYTNTALNEYSYMLEGYEEQWSEWTNKTVREYINLEKGWYTFKIKARNIYNIESEISSFVFYVKPAWYRTYLAYFVYFILLIILIIAVFNIRLHKIERDKIKLENIVEQRTLEVERQSKEIKLQSEKLRQQTEKLAKQTERLTLTNLELKHLSLVAQETVNSVVLLDKKGRFEWWNKGFTQLFSELFEQYKNEDFRTKQKKLRPDLIKEIKNYKRERGTINYTTHLVFESEKEIWFQTTLNPVYDEEGEIFRFVAIDVDITKQKLAEIEINKQKEEIEKQAAELLLINQELSMQKNAIARQNQATIDSIWYAKRIQEAMLPPILFIEVVLPENFIFFRPRDIVSGDFYWFAHKEGKILMAAADCTGHGIPGAFMSMLGLSALKEILTRLENISSDEILNILREHIIISLHQSGKQGEAADGMDIALCVLDEEKMELEYSGANNPLYLLRQNESAEFEIITYKPDKMPIGIYYNMQSNFNKHTIKLLTNDRIYIFTDGYEDQFGGEEGKKFLSKNFRTLLQSIQKYSMDEQKTQLEQTLELWKGNNEQVDDILIIGIKI